MIILGILLALLLLLRASRGNAFIAVMTVPEELQGREELKIVSEDDSILRIRGYSVDGGRLRIELEPGKAGFVEVSITDPSDPENMAFDYFRVGKMKTVYQESTGEFGGDRVLMIGALIFLCLLSYMLLDDFRKAAGTALYSYGTLHSIGFGIFTLFAAVVLAISLVRLYADPAYTMRSVFSTLTFAAGHFMLYTLPFIVLFAALMTVSNISLIRHEGFRIRNMFGILIGILLIGGEAFEYFFNLYVSGSELEILIHDTINSVYCTVFVYFECVLIGAIFCGIRAARYRPDPDKDYIVILGCKISGSGTLTPLLRGRVDRAVSFAKEQEEKTGKKAVFVPSGGKGPDECMAEADAMKKYLLSVGIDEGRILAEDQSRNTFENMKFSKKLIEGQDPSARVCFSTTNYHVFRSGLWAQLAGLDAEGIGSDTKWYFWPNAFMRECVGLMANHIRTELMLLAMFTAFYAILTVLLN